MKDFRIVFDQWVSVNIISNVSKGSNYNKKKTQTYFSSCFSLVSIFFIKYIVTHCSITLYLCSGVKAASRGEWTLECECMRVYVYVWEGCWW